MKKWIMCFMGAMMALSLAACKPTQVTESAPQVMGSNPEGLTPEMVKENKEVVEKVGEIGAPTFEMAFIYSGNSDATGLVRETVDLEELTEQVLVDCLIEAGVLEEGTTVNSFEIEGGEKAGPGVAADAAGSGERVGILDLSQISVSKTAEETVMLNAIANTFIENYELDKLKLLINGENYQSETTVHGDEDYLYYIDNYEKF